MEKHLPKNDIRNYEVITLEMQCDPKIISASSKEEAIKIFKRLYPKFKGRIEVL